MLRRSSRCTSPVSDMTILAGKGWGSNPQTGASSPTPQPESCSMKYTIPLVFLSLAGCGAGVVPPPAVEIRTVTKTVEVQKPCPVTVPARPPRLAKPLPTDAVKLAATLGAALAAYTAPGAWADRMEAALGQCTKP